MYEKILSAWRLSFMETQPKGKCQLVVFLDDKNNMYTPKAPFKVNFLDVYNTEKNHRCLIEAHLFESVRPYKAIVILPEDYDINRYKKSKSSTKLLESLYRKEDGRKKTPFFIDMHYIYSAGDYIVTSYIDTPEMVNRTFFFFHKVFAVRLNSSQLKDFDITGAFPVEKFKIFHQTKTSFNHDGLNVDLFEV